MGRIKKTKPPSESTDDKLLVSLACRFGSMGAIVFKQFDATLDGLPDDAVNYLRRCWAATIDLDAGDAGKEIGLLRDALCKLRDEWKENPGG